MSYFWYTSETIPDGFGFPMYGTVHLVWLAVFVLLTVGMCLLYRTLHPRGRDIWRRAVAFALVTDEMFKVIPMLFMGLYRADYLPFHLCSVNIIVIAIHSCKRTKLLDSFLYTICIPGALAALLFPSWTNMPAMNFMCIHSFTVHILLALYPIVLTVAGEIRPTLRDLPRCLLLLIVLAAFAYGINLLLNTNFMFLMRADEGNPLSWFEAHWGSHLLGFPVIIAAVIVVMYAPWLIARRAKLRTR